MPKPTIVPPNKNAMVQNFFCILNNLTEIPPVNSAEPPTSIKMTPMIHPAGMGGTVYALELIILMPIEPNKIPINIKAATV